MTARGRSLSSVLRRPPVVAHPRRVEVPAPGAPPAELLALLEAERRDAFERGRAAGFEEGRTAAAETTAQLLAEVRASLEGGLGTLRRWRLEEARRAVDLALRITRHVLGREPVEAATVLARVRQALEAIDDGPLELVVHPDQVPALREALDPTTVTVRGDPALASGEARIRGPWSSADLTYDAACQAIGEVLGASGGGLTA